MDNEICEPEIVKDRAFRLNMVLWLAVKYNQFKKARKALAKNATLLSFTGPELQRFDVDENTPLHIAAKQGFIELVVLLWKYGSDIDARNRLNQTPLHCAASAGHMEVVEWLIKYGADINAIDGNGDSALMLATKNSQTDVVEYLNAQSAELY